MKKIASLLFVGVLALSIFISFYNLEKRCGFEWDQERDAQIVYGRIIQQKSPTLIGPRVVGPEGFFLGPLHYYIMTPFYFFTQGDPVAGPILAGIVGVLTAVTVFYVTKKLFGIRAGLIAMTFSALLTEKLAWNVMYMALITILTYFFILKFLNDKKYRNILWAFVAIAVGMQFHFITIFLLLMLGIALIQALLDDKKNRRKIVRYSTIGTFIFLFSFIPLVLFDIRHNFINTHNFIGFFSGNTGVAVSLNGVAVFLRNKTILTSIQPMNLNTFMNIFVSIVYLFMSIKLFPKLWKFHVAWIAAPIILFSLYAGAVSEYYFLTITTLTLIYFAVFLAKLSRLEYRNKPVGIVLISTLLAIVVLAHINFVLTSIHPRSLHNKKEIIQHISQSTNDPVRISFVVPIGMEVGYNYLIDFYDIEVTEDSAAERYMLFMDPIKPDYAPIKTSGDIHLQKEQDP